MPKQKTVKINDKEFVLQHPGARWYLGANDRCRNNAGVLQMEAYYQELLENVVVDPKVSIEDFDDDFGTLEKLMSAVERFLRGKK